MQVKKFATGPCWGSPETDAIRTIGPTIRIVGLMSVSSSVFPWWCHGHPQVPGWSLRSAGQNYTPPGGHTQWAGGSHPSGQVVKDSISIPIGFHQFHRWNHQIHHDENPQKSTEKSFRNCLFQDQWQLSEAFLRHAFHLLVTLTQECWIPPLLQHSYSWSQ